ALRFHASIPRGRRPRPAWSLRSPRSRCWSSPSPPTRWATISPRPTSTSTPPGAGASPTAVRLQRHVHSSLPFDVLAAAPVVRRASQPDDGLIARKGAVAFYGGVRPVWFPRVASLAALAAHAQANRARFLYFSWYEGKLRPEFWYLLDTSAVVPGLTRIASVLAPAAVLYRIEPGFGADPDWMADSTERMVHVARGEIRVLEDTDAFTIR